MKLIYISHWRFPSEKTMSPLILKTCEGFARLGFKVELVIPWRQNPEFKKADPFAYHHIEKNFSITHLPVLDFTLIFPGAFWFWVLLFSFNISLFFYLIFHSKKIDFFYAHDGRDLFLLSYFSKPFFVEIHDFYKSSKNILNERVFKLAQGFIVTNHYKIEMLKAKFGIPENRLLYQPNAVDIHMFNIDLTQEDARKKLNLPPRPKIILYTGHLFDWKGVDVLFDANEFLNEGEVIYFVGGTDEDINKFKVKSEKLKIKNVKIVGRRPHEEIPIWLRAADVLILPNTAKVDASKYETSPVKLFEYMASGRPIVASDIPSVKDIVNDSLVFFFEADNPRSLARQVKYVFDNPREAELRSVAAVSEVEKYSWGKRAEHIVNFIRHTL